jgi:hypothetical protein
VASCDRFDAGSVGGGVMSSQPRDAATAMRHRLTQISQPHLPVNESRDHPRIPRAATTAASVGAKNANAQARRHYDKLTSSTSAHNNRRSAASF